MTIINLHETISALRGTLFASVIIISLLYSMIFKFGATKGRIVLFAAVLAIYGIGA